MTQNLIAYAGDVESKERFDAIAVSLSERMRWQEGWEAGFAEAKRVLEWRERMAKVLGKIGNFILMVLVVMFFLMQLVLATHKLGVEEGQKRPIVNEGKADKIGMLIENLPEAK